MQSVDFLDVVNRFVTVAQAYCAWMSAPHDNAAASMLRLHLILARLQVAAVELPVTWPDHEEAETIEDDATTEENGSPVVVSRLPFTEYRFVFAPLDTVDQEILSTTIEDDLDDIYRDLMRGLRSYEAGKYEQAVWEWRFAYFSHWGRHLSHAQTAIWQYLSQGGALQCET